MLHHVISYIDIYVSLELTTSIFRITFTLICQITHVRILPLPVQTLNLQTPNTSSFARCAVFVSLQLPLVLRRKVSNDNITVRFDLLTAVLLTVRPFWDMSLRSSI
jgi:hypothetical protein